MSEFCSNDAAVAVWSGDFAPDHSDLAALSFCGGTVDVGDALAEVESRSKKCQFQDEKIVTRGGRESVGERVWHGLDAAEGDLE